MKRQLLRSNFAFLLPPPYSLVGGENAYSTVIQHCMGLGDRGQILHKVYRKGKMSQDVLKRILAMANNLSLMRSLSLVRKALRCTLASGLPRGGQEQGTADGGGFGSLKTQTGQTKKQRTLQGERNTDTGEASSPAIHGSSTRRQGKPRPFRALEKNKQTNKQKQNKTIIEFAYLPGIEFLRCCRFEADEAICPMENPVEEQAFSQENS